MEWERISEAPEKLKVHLTQSETHAMVQALVDYNLSRLRKGRAALRPHMNLLGNVSGDRRAALSCDTVNYRRFVRILIGYAGTPSEAATDSSNRGRAEWMGFEDLAAQRTQEGQVARTLAEDIKSAVLEFEGRSDAQMTVDEFVHEI